MTYGGALGYGATEGFVGSAGFSGGASQLIEDVAASVVFDSAGTIIESFNVSSVVRNAMGDFTINFATNLANTNYAEFYDTPNTNSTRGGSGAGIYEGQKGVNKQVGSIRIATLVNSSDFSAGAVSDMPEMSAMFLSTG